jgi:hypothetical protein
MARDSRAPEQVNVRLNDACREELEEYRRRKEREVQKSVPGYKLTHTEALRTLLIAALKSANEIT